MKMNHFFFPVILNGAVLLFLEKMPVKTFISGFLLRPPSKAKKRKLLLGASTGSPAEESSDSASYANLSRNTKVGGTYFFVHHRYGVKRVSASSASYANGLAFDPPSDRVARLPFGALTTVFQAALLHHQQSLVFY